jgi:hypothetical protein
MEFVVRELDIGGGGGFRNSKFTCAGSKLNSLVFHKLALSSGIKHQAV